MGTHLLERKSPITAGLWGGPNQQPEVEVIPEITIAPIRCWPIKAGQFFVRLASCHSFVRTRAQWQIGVYADLVSAAIGL